MAADFGTLGRLVVSLEANTAQFSSALGKASQEAQERFETIAGAATKLGSVLGVALSVDSFTEFAKSALEAAVQYENAQNRVIAALKATGNASGLVKDDLDALADSLQRTTQFDDKDIINAEAQFLKFGNIQTTVFTRGLKLAADLASYIGKDLPDAAQQLGRALAEPEKGFGRLAREIGPLTKAQDDAIRSAVDLGDTMKAQVLILDAVDGKLGGTAALINTGLNKAVEDAKKSWDEFLKSLGRTPAVQDVAKTALALISPSNVATQVLSPDFKGLAVGPTAKLPDPFKLANTINDPEFLKGQATAAAKFKEINDQSEAETKKSIANNENYVKEAKVAIEAQLKTIESAVASEKNLLSGRNQIIDFYNSQNLISIHDYYAAKDTAQQENLKNTLADYDKEIGALQSLKAKQQSVVNDLKSQEVVQADRDKTATANQEVIATQNKINDLINKKTEIQKQSTTTSVLNSLQEQKALNDYADSVQKVNADILELKGDLAGAAAIRFDQQNKQLKDIFSKEHNQAALENYETLKKYAEAQAQVNKLVEDSTLLQNAEANTEERIRLDQQLGAISEVQGLIKTSAARQELAKQLEATAEAYEAIARAAGDLDVSKKFQQDADNLRLVIDKLKADSDLLGQKFDTIFKDAFGSAFADFVTGAKSASDAFKAFTDQVVADIAKIAAQDVANQLLGVFGASSDGVSPIGSFFSNLFGGGSSSSNSGSSSISDTFSGFGSSISDFVGSIFGGGKAIGGPVTAGTTYLVGENGPELFTAPSGGGNIVPNGQWGGGTTNINVYNSAPVDRNTQQQIAAKVANAVQRASVRNN